jgi:diguanylate cyclase (GGDEF)-like protein/PAS domain S-box-containing protein
MRFMKKQSWKNFYIWFVITLGVIAFTYYLTQLPLSIVSFQFFLLAVFTIGLGSQITIQIPKFKSHIAVSDTFIFLAAILYGGEAAVTLAVIEAVCSSWRFCNKKITVVFNAAVMACSTTVMVLALKLFSFDISTLSQSNNYANFVVALSLMGFVQYIFNSGLASIFSSLRNEKPIFQTWKTYYLWTSITYFIGATAAGVGAKMVHVIGFKVIIATAPVTIFIYFTYRMYLKNVEMSLTQAEQAERHAKALELQSIALRESEERFRSAFSYAPIGIALVSPDGHWLKVNKSLCEIVGYNEEELLTKDFQSITNKEDLGDTLVAIHGLLTGNIQSCQSEQRYIHSSGMEVWVHWSASTASDSKSDRPNLIFQIQDITNRKKAEYQLQYEATHDALTGLPNRTLFTSRLEQALNNSKRCSGNRLSVLFIDLDRFKVVNDSLGHLIGDQLLINIANRLRECVRPSDTVARLGGDEFTILVQDARDNEVLRIAERIKGKFATPFNLSGHEIYSSASIGILHSTANHKSPEELMRDADIAMYQAKRSGKARHEIFSQNMHEAVKETLQLETELRRAIEREELTVDYQPIFSLENGKLEGFEALARWTHHEKGNIPPYKFIPLAEETDLIDDLGEIILRKACTQGRRWQEMFPNCFPLVMSVNLSGKQFAQPNMVQNIKRVLDETDFDPRYLKLEITESVVFEHKEKAIEMLLQLRAFGVEINIDDFGTGYSNLSSLSQLPVSTLKIDRSFIGPMNGNRRDSEIVQTIVMLAHSLGMKVIAEGVETETQLEQLKALRCEGAQGYFFSKPMNADKATEFLATKFEQVVSIPNVQNFENISVIATVQ